MTEHVPKPTAPLPDMPESTCRPWIMTAVLLGIFYASVGIVFAIPTDHVKSWRLAAWVISALAYGFHICYERFRLRNPPLSAALHVAYAVALGAFGLTVGANVHSLAVASTSGHRHLLLLALGIWPVITSLPAFLIALAATSVLARSASRP